MSAFNSYLLYSLVIPEINDPETIAKCRTASRSLYEILNDKVPRNQTLSRSIPIPFLEATLRWAYEASERQETLQSMLSDSVTPDSSEYGTEMVKWLISLRCPKANQLARFVCECETKISDRDLVMCQNYGRYISYIFQTRKTQLIEDEINTLLQNRTSYLQNTLVLNRLGPITKNLNLEDTVTRIICLIVKISAARAFELIIQYLMQCRKYEYVTMEYPLLHECLMTAIGAGVSINMITLLFTLADSRYTQYSLFEMAILQSFQMNKTRGFMPALISRLQNDYSLTTTTVISNPRSMLFVNFLLGSNPKLLVNILRSGDSPYAFTAEQFVEMFFMRWEHSLDLNRKYQEIIESILDFVPNSEWVQIYLNLPPCIKRQVSQTNWYNTILSEI